MKKFVTHLAILFVVVAIVMVGCEEKVAPKGDINGVVKDKTTTQLINGANVKLSPGGLSQTTSEDGKFIFRELSPGDYTLTITKDGYTTLGPEEISVASGQSSLGDKLLSPILPVLGIETISLDFSTSLSTLSVDVTNKSTGGTLTWSVVEDVPWLSVTPQTGSNTTEKSSFTVTIDRTGVAAGLYEKTIAVNSNGGNHLIAIKMEVLGSKVVTDKTSLDFSTTENSKTILISNGATGTLTFSAVSDQPWLTVTPETGSITTNIQVVTATINRNGLANENFSARIIVNTNGGNLIIPVLVSNLVTTAATIFTTAVTDYTQTSAVMGGNVIADGYAEVTERGICFGTQPNPTTADNKAEVGKGIGTFTKTINTLLANTAYYVRAYAINSKGTAYGAQQIFTTLNSSTLPNVNTIIPTQITQNLIAIGGNVTSDGGSAVLARGVCFGQTNNPTISGSKTSDGTGIGAFTSTISALQANTTYYIRAFATNSNGTSYGTQQVITTLSEIVLPTIATSVVNNITQISAITGGNITTDGGSPITQRGVCYGIAPNPTTASSKTADGVGTGAFVTNLAGLTANTTYYLRAYATNSAGTSYGLQQTFATLPVPVVATVETETPTQITQTTAVFNGKVVANGGETVTERGFCYATTPNPTIVSLKISVGDGLGIFTTTVETLAENTTYYVRAFATNSVGTSYGEERTFVTTNNSIIIETVNIPAGTFTMGSPLNEPNRGTDETQHQVTLSAFKMSKYEITNAQFAAFLNAKGIGGNGLYNAGSFPTQPLVYSNSSLGLTYSGSQWIPVAGCENHPIVKVTWYGATEFANFVGGKLPTEAQWEYSCRAGTSTPFYTGSCLSNEQGNYNWSLPYFGNNCTNTVSVSPNKSQRVGSYLANAFGLHDMHGNVSEWCSDWYGEYLLTTVTNPKGAIEGIYRVARDAGFLQWAMHCRSAQRGNDYPNKSFDGTGFRIVIYP